MYIEIGVLVGYRNTIGGLEWIQKHGVFYGPLGKGETAGKKETDVDKAMADLSKRWNDDVKLLRETEGRCWSGEEEMFKRKKKDGCG